MPTKWPCDRAIACPCSDNPLGNFSSELPDPFTFFARRFFPNPLQLDDPNRDFTSTACGQACHSEVSQADADACALKLAVECTQPPPPGAPGDPVLFGNRAVSCQADCPEGPPFILNIAPGTYLARTQELADLIAQSFCQADVITFRHCEMPPMPPPPSAVCPHITSQTASPINANDGDNVTMTVNYTYNSPLMLMFVWFKDGVATYPTSNSSLTLNAVGPGDDGQYILGIFASGCFPVFSSPIQLNVTASCPPEAGPNAPATLDIAHTTDWETFTIDNPDLSPLLSSNAGCNPTGLFIATPTNGLDHPPGIYGFRYITGFFGGVDAFCPPATPISGSVNVFSMVDEGFNYDSPIVCNIQDLAHECRTMPGDPPPAGNFGGGLFVNCAVNNADVINQLQVFWADKTFICDPYPPDNLLDFSHTNTSGRFSLYFNDPGTFTIIGPLQLKVVQAAGNIPQPRKLQIDDFATVAAQFSDAAVGANWSGNFDTRTTYTSATLLWSQPASGGFGGATIEWFNGHPTSPNGFGWKMKVFAGATLVWQGLAGRGETPITRFYKDTTATVQGPDCLTVSDASTTNWFP